MFGNSVNNIGKNAFRDCTGLTSLTFTNPEPPTIGTDAFSGTATNIITVNVPCGSLSAYGIRLPNFIHFEEVYTSFTAESEDVNKGAVQIVTMPSCTDHTAVLQAVPANGYHFVSWNDNNTSNPRNVMVMNNVTLSARFAPNVGIEAPVEGQPSAVLSPNPASGETMLMLNGREGQVEVKVVDLAGRTVLTLQAAGDAAQPTPLDLSNLQPGSYFVRIAGDNVSLVRKLVVR